jgi:hypothetical protein
VGDNQNRTFTTPKFNQKAFDPVHDITKTFPAREGIIDELCLGRMQLLNGTPRPAAVIAFAQPSIRNAPDPGSCKCDLGG